MDAECRWTIEELCVRYELEPGLRDVFLEGAFDCDVLGQVVHLGADAPVLYCVDAVDVPLSVLAKHGLSLGNKQRLVALSRELEGVNPSARVTCVVDRDLDHWLGVQPPTGRLRWTKYCSIEGHFLSPACVRDVIAVAARAKVKKFDRYFESLVQVMRDLFALRLADRELGWSLRWVATRRYLSSSGDAVVFDGEGYGAALLSSNARTRQSAEFCAAREAWLKKLGGDAGMAARGHDFTELLAWSISEFNGDKELATEVAVERVFVLLARSVDSLKEELA